MSLSEFGLIRKYFKRALKGRKHVSVGIGDDCALTDVPKGQLLAITVDTLVKGIHFLPSTRPEDLASKAIAVNLSDLAAMGAEPAWMTLALTIPDTDEEWLSVFNKSLFKYADFYGIQLIGGDTTRGPLTITIQAMGFVPPKAAPLRSGAKAGDVIFITGTIGDAGMGLSIITGEHKPENEESAHFLTQRYNKPTPRVALGLGIRKIASSAIDLSDGLAGDLSHILDASNVGAVIELESLPLSEALLSECDSETAVKYALSSGDDYELCFTVPEDNIEKLEKALKSTGCVYKQVGRITGGRGITYTREGNKVELQMNGYSHFKSSRISSGSEGD